MPASKQVLLGAIGKEMAKRMLKEKGRELAGALREALPVGQRSLVVLSDGATTAFFSDSSREEVVAMLREVLAELEGKPR